MKTKVFTNPKLFYAVKTLLLENATRPTSGIKSPKVINAGGPQLNGNPPLTYYFFHTLMIRLSRQIDQRPQYNYHPP